VGFAHISDHVVSESPVVSGKGDKILIYYCLMATWTGLGDNTELFWAVLSQWRYHPVQILVFCLMLFFSLTYLFKVLTLIIIHFNIKSCGK
jgi:hypothetical protein